MQRNKTKITTLKKNGIKTQNTICTKERKTENSNNNADDDEVTIEESEETGQNTSR